MDDNMVDMTNFFDRPWNEKRSPRPKPLEHNSEQCPTPQNSPTHMAKLPVSLVRPHRNEVWGILPDKRRVPHGWPACLRRQPPRVAFRNNDIYLVEVWYSLEQYIGLKEDKLSSTTVDFIRSEGNLETKRLYWFSKPKMC